MNNIYINSATHISNQEPFSEKWFAEPIVYNERYIRAIEPDYKQFFTPNEARRMGKILKRALTTALQVIEKTGITQPDAIITGTGLGCIENTEKFLVAMLENNEELLPPTYFMQSTHNTISSQIAVHLKCNGYNSTYSHRGTSFDSALLDACMQFELGEISTALVGGHDELTPAYFLLLDKIGYWKKGGISEQTLRAGNSMGAFAGECSVSFMLSNLLKPDSLCELKTMELLYKPTKEQFANTLNTMLNKSNITMEHIDTVVMGINGDMENDHVYKEVYSCLFPDKPLVWYKHIFGESYTASGLGMYVAANILQKKHIPQHLLHTKNVEISALRNILVYNHFQNKDHSLTLLSCLD
jgi:3-oxoacyl-(acyl-carrier-protein) synthase